MNVIDFILGCLAALIAFGFGYIFGKRKQTSKSNK